MAHPPAAAGGTSTWDTPGPSTGWPTYSPTASPSSTIESIMRSGTWFQSGQGQEFDDLQISLYQARSKQGVRGPGGAKKEDQKSLRNRNSRSLLQVRNHSRPWSQSPLWHHSRPWSQSLHRHQLQLRLHKSRLQHRFRSQLRHQQKLRLQPRFHSRLRLQPRLW